MWGGGQGFGRGCDYLKPDTYIFVSLLVLVWALLLDCGRRQRRRGGSISCCLQGRAGSCCAACARCWLPGTVESVSVQLGFGRKPTLPGARHCLPTGKAAQRRAVRARALIARRAGRVGPIPRAILHCPFHHLAFIASLDLYARQPAACVEAWLRLCPSVGAMLSRRALVAPLTTHKRLIAGPRAAPRAQEERPACIHIGAAASHADPAWRLGRQCVGRAAVRTSRLAGCGLLHMCHLQR